MADLLQDTQTEENTATEETTAEKGTGTDQTKTAKTFTQDELNKIVAKEKATWKKQNDRLSADHETIVATKDKEISARDELITEQVDLLAKDLELDEETMELLNGLDVLARYKWLMNKVEKAAKTDIPRTPRSDRKQPVSPFRRTQTV